MNLTKLRSRRSGWIHTRSQVDTNCRE